LILCGYGGYCARTPDHQGAHTRDYNPKTRKFDQDTCTLDARLERAIQAVRAITDAATLALLDYPAPWYADLRDHEAA
jgi:hypothetical protein